MKGWFGFHFQGSSSRCEDLIKAYPRSKKHLHWPKNRSTVLANNCGSFQKQLGVWVGSISTTPGKLCSFCPYLRLETVSPAIKLPRNNYINMNIDSPTPSHHTTMSERQSSQSDKIWKQGYFENLIFSTFQWVGKNFEVMSKLIFKILIFSSFHELGKTKVQLKQHSKIPVFNFFLNWEKPRSTA